MGCPFCQIIEREKPARIFLEDGRVIVFADILPRAAVHLLICPKDHLTSLMELPEELLVKLIETVKSIAGELSIEDNFKLVLHHGAQAGQIVEHLHFHFLSDAGGVKLIYKR